MKLRAFIIVALVAISTSIFAQTKTVSQAEYDALLKRVENLEKTKTSATPKKGKFRLGGYGEAVFTRNFYSNRFQRYVKPELFEDADGHGRVDMPHVVLMMDYGFGKGWSFSTELEFEHGGVGSAVEMEAEENGEYESEIEKGGEFVIEQMWLQKSFSKAFNIRAGHIIVPVGGTNTRHLPTQFFGNYRPEGDNTIIPCTWHQTGISFWGRKGDWRYEAQILPGLDGMLFSNSNWIKSGATSPYEFKIANSYAGMLRIDNYSIKNLSVGVSAYIGNSAINSLKQDNYDDFKSTVSIIALDFNYKSKNGNWIARGSGIYGGLTDNKELSAANKRNRNESPSPKTNVAKNAISIGVEAGYNLFAFCKNEKLKDEKLYLFARYDYYDSMYKTGSILDEDKFERTCLSAGLNYYPIKQLVIKAEYKSRMFNTPYNNEPSISLGVAFAGFFVK